MSDDFYSLTPPLSRQAEKYHLSLSDEFYVAAELQRRGISAAVTYGNAKKADVVAFSASGERAVIIEVKSTSQQKWVIGSRAPASSPKPWVLVYIPSDKTEAPSFYVVLQSELHNIMAPLDEEYSRRYLEKHGEEYGDRPGVANFTRSQAAPYKDAWGKIINQILV